MVIGQRFCTPYEHGCIVTSLPDEDGEFLALDSDGVECSFNVDMITLHDHVELA